MFKLTAIAHIMDYTLCDWCNGAQVHTKQDMILFTGDAAAFAARLRLWVKEGIPNGLIWSKMVLIDKTGERRRLDEIHVLAEREQAIFAGKPGSRMRPLEGSVWRQLWDMSKPE